MQQQPIVGIDEVGRGPFAGPVVAAAVVLSDQHPGSRIMDSKKLTAKKRQSLYHTITECAQAWAWGYADVSEIDDLNILQASLLAMKRAVMALPLHTIGYALIDGLQAPDLPCPTQTLVRGDQYHPAISAASIVAKVIRDQCMIDYDSIYPQYGFAQHKGYGTLAHRQALHKHGPCAIHRQSFAPVRQKTHG
jgi:ribonuclease HII